jgi:hypothetical protein
MATISDFFADVVCDEGKRGRIYTDLEGLMEEAELTEPQKKAIRSRDPLRLRHVIEYELDLDLDDDHIWIMWFQMPPAS